MSLEHNSIRPSTRHQNRTASQSLVQLVNWRGNSTVIPVTTILFMLSVTGCALAPSVSAAAPTVTKPGISQMPNADHDLEPLVETELWKRIEAFILSDRTYVSIEEFEAAIGVRHDRIKEVRDKSGRIYEFPPLADPRISFVDFAVDYSKPKGAFIAGFAINSIHECRDNCITLTYLEQKLKQAGWAVNIFAFSYLRELQFDTQNMIGRAKLNGDCLEDVRLISRDATQPPFRP
jgi:hypothetical protein